jgi:hypothetical protein
MRLDWGSPKIALGEFHSYLQTMLGDKFDGLVEEQGYLYINTFQPITGDEEAAILTYYYSLSSKPLNTAVVSQPDPTPFAQPTYRTKRNATDSVLEVEPNSDGEVQFKLLQERYVSGGCLLVYNAQPGDYVVAEVEDVDGIIPAPYRAALCENHPVVATYIEKEWVHANPDGLTTHEINTHPLNAKITAGLYLCLHYYAANSGQTRQIYINYYLTKKL